ncbi:DsbA family protein [Agrobacterium pusense]|uniref:DsbA family protein n=1 Tax=Agrobacterium pusense TaxID=648995 RepID=UPI001C6E6CEF|nr:DsbA family protein [Agrobacterium pusense]MBW9067538.1 DsbA family protein [Agrobacterium pusense]MBW9082516.1 DsbA family protein [Agrobacterium pusense]MBW9125238.1 DsbA family protein [Agrobacterium pusense]MBW9135976.1 DsbA family protein [Agrobacterium pusense]
MAHFLRSTLLASVTALSTVFASLPAHALDEQQKKEMGEFIKQYLIENPEIMLEVQDALERKQYAARNAKAAEAVADNKKAIFESKFDLALGNPDGDVTLVEFFDYNCGYCKRAMGDMDNILKSDKKIRVVLKEFPILGPESVAAHRVSNAVKLLAPAKYPEFQRTLLGGRGRANEDSAMEVATSLGLKEADIRKSMAENPNDAQVQETYKLANSLGITGTPSYIVGDEAVFGAVGADPLKEKIANMRSCGKATCS